MKIEWVLKEKTLFAYLGGVVIGKVIPENGPVADPKWCWIDMARRSREFYTHMAARQDFENELTKCSS